MGFEADIFITESNRKTDAFDNHSLQKTLKYILKKDPETKKFSMITIECDVFYYYEDFYAVVCIPEVKYTCKDYLTEDNDLGKMTTLIEIDVNNMDYAECDQMTVYVYVDAH